MATTTSVDLVIPTQPNITATLRDVLVSLNNSAIILLKRGQYRASIDTFKDALSIQKSTANIDSYNQALENTERRKSGMSALPDNNTNHDVMILSSLHDPKHAYNLLINSDTSKVCLTLEGHNNETTIRFVRSILVYNYAVAHRCLKTSIDTLSSSAGSAVTNQISTFCFQVFQYAESLMPDNDTTNLLLYKWILTRNLMMISCSLGLPISQLYRDIFDPIEAEIIGQQQSTFENQYTPAA